MTATWAALFDRAAGVETSESELREALAERRDRERETDGGAGDGSDDPPESAEPTRVVADADVLAADVVLGGAAREALDAVRGHSWIDLLASDPLLADAQSVIATVVSGRLGEGTAPDPDGLADDWAERVREERVEVRQPPGDHPGLASAYRGGAAHLLSFDERLTSARAGLAVQPHAALSTRRPEAFAAVFDAAALYGMAVGGDYPGPDRDPRD